MSEEAEPKLGDLVKIRLKNWRQVGSRLGFPESELSQIEDQAQWSHDPYSLIKRKLFAGWKTKYSPKPTNRAVVQALIDVGERNTADAFCRTHGIDCVKCDRSERERLKEPEHSLGQLQMIFRISSQQRAFHNYLDEHADRVLRLLINQLQPDLQSCNWEAVLNEIQFNLPNFNYYPNINLEFQPELDEIVPIFFRGKRFKTSKAVDIQNIIKKVNRECKKMNLPRSWYMVLFILVERGGIITLEQYKSLAQECNVPENKIDYLLEYVHEHFGLILHYKDIPDLKESVICSSSLILRECCSLIKHILHTCPDTKRTGLVPASVVDQFISVNSEASIAWKILSHYCFTAKYQQQVNRTNYFIPFLLKEHADLNKLIAKNSDYPASVLVRFPSEVPSTWFFYSLSCCLAEKFYLSNKLDYSRRRTSFVVNSIQLVLIAQKKFIELQLLDSLYHIPAETYDFVLRDVILSLQKLSVIYENATFTFNFTCPGSVPQRLHLSKPIDGSNLQCLGEPPCPHKVFNSQKHHAVWGLAWKYDEQCGSHASLFQLATLSEDDMETESDVINFNGASNIMNLLENRLKEEGGVPFRVAKAVLYGPPGCGKTTVCRRLTGQLKNLSTDHKPYGSTGIDNPITIDLYYTVDQTSVFIEGQENSWAPQTIQQQVQMLIHYLMKTKPAEPLALSMAFSQQSLVPLGTTLLPMHANALGSSTAIAVPHPNTISSPPSSAQQVPDVTMDDDVQTTDSPITDATTSPKWDKSTAIVFDTLKKMVQDQEWKELKNIFENINEGTLLNIIDTGGQPEFHDILPLLIRGPSLFLIFLKLCQPLDELVRVSYRITENEEAGNSYESRYTPRDVVHQVLSLCDSLGEDYAAFLVGSHKDQLADHSEIEKMDESIQQSLKNTAFFNKDRLKRYDGKHYIYPVDNMNGNINEIEGLQRHILKVVEKFRSKELPPSWWLFHLMLKYLFESKKTCKLDEATRLASELNISEEDVPKILQFIDYNFGTILYYKNIPCLSGVVICDPGVVFKPIAKLVGESFGANPDRPASSERIRKSGIIPPELVEDICDHESNCIIPLESIIEILKEANVVTEMKGKNHEILLFMPCLLLPDPSVEDYSSRNIYDYDPSSPLPLLFNFSESTGYVPVSLFNALVIKLSQSCDWILHDKHRFKNRMRFIFYNSCTSIDPTPSIVELLAHKSFIEVLFIENPTSAKCILVRECISQEIMEIMSSHLHMKNIKMTVGFFCPGGASHALPHPATFRDHAPPKSPANVAAVVCTEDCNPTIRRLGNSHKCWFDDQVPLGVEQLVEPMPISTSFHSSNSLPSISGLVMTDANKSNNEAESITTTTHVVHENTDDDMDVDVILHNDGTNIINVLRATKAVPYSKWHTLALLLGIDNATVGRIKAENTNDCSAVQMEVVQAWLASGQATWIGLVNSLKDDLIQLNEMANNICKQYIRNDS